MSKCVGDGTNDCPFHPDQCPFAAAGNLEPTREEPRPGAAQPRPVGWGRVDTELRNSLAARERSAEPALLASLTYPDGKGQAIVAAVTPGFRLDETEIHIALYDNWKSTDPPELSKRPNVHIHRITYP